MFTWRHGGHVGGVNKETEVILEEWNILLGIKLYFYANLSFCFIMQTIMASGHMSEHTLLIPVSIASSNFAQKGTQLYVYVTSRSVLWSLGVNHLAVFRASLSVNGYRRRVTLYIPLRSVVVRTRHDACLYFSPQMIVKSPRSVHRHYVSMYPIEYDIGISCTSQMRDWDCCFFFCFFFSFFVLIFVGLLFLCFALLFSDIHFLTLIKSRT